MTASAVAQSRAEWGRGVALVCGLALIAGVRFLLERSPLAGFGAGAIFGALLLVLAIGSGWRPERPTWTALAMGAVGGFTLVAIPRVLDPASGAFVGVRARPMVLWIVLTILVSASEEMVLRGSLFDAVRGPAGTVVAIGVTSAAFALIHVPLYGWSVVPLDLAVGVALAGLRISTGGIIAPAIAHAMADLATW